MPMNKRLRTQRRSNFHALFFCFQNLKNIRNLPSSTSNVANIVQFSKGIEKLWNVCYKEGSMFGDG
jgi:hypothetical protein